MSEIGLKMDLTFAGSFGAGKTTQKDISACQE
jgi:hypothetical protein